MTAIEPVNESGFSGADVYRVRTDAGDFALRRWPVDSLPDARISELHRFLGFLRQSGIEFVAVPLADESGATVVSFQESRWQLEPWMPGTALRPNPPPKHLANAMRALARLHVAAARYQSTQSGQTWFFQDPARESPAVVERLRLIRDFGEDRVREIAAACGETRPVVERLLQMYIFLLPMIARDLESCAPLKFRLQPCLRDVHREHVLLSGDEVTGIIDPSAARSENVASDLSRLLGSVVGSGPWEPALDAYTEVRPLGEDERRLAQALDRSGVLLSALTWMRRGAEGAGLSERELQRVNEIQQRLTRLAE